MTMTTSTSLSLNNTAVTASPPAALAEIAEMAVWDPSDECADAGQALSELDQRSMHLMAGLGLLTLGVALGSLAWTLLA